MEKKERRAISYDAEDANGASAAQSQLRKRFELGGDSTATTHPSVIRAIERTTTRPAPVPEEATRGRNGRPTIPTPRPLISLGAIPRRLVDERAMMGLPLDHRAAFLLMSIDGKTSIGSLVDVTGMQPEEVLVLIERLVELRAVSIL